MQFLYVCVCRMAGLRHCCCPTCNIFTIVTQRTKYTRSSSLILSLFTICFMRYHHAIALNAIQNFILHLLLLPSCQRATFV